MTEVFKFTNGRYTTDINIFFGNDRVIEKAILRNCTKDEVDLILESLYLEIG